MKTVSSETRLREQHEKALAEIERLQEQLKWKQAILDDKDTNIYLENDRYWLTGEHINKIVAAHRAVVAREKVLVEALEFYALEKIYIGEYVSDYSGETHCFEILDDHGARARAALEKK